MRIRAEAEVTVDGNLAANVLVLLLKAKYVVMTARNSDCITVLSCKNLGQSVVINNRKMKTVLIEHSVMCC